MPTRQYVGARYVPKFANPIEWNSNRSYEALEIVTYLNNSYTSKKPVPVGTDITNGEYWVVTGNYNAQVEQYRQEVEAYAEKAEGLNAGFRNVETYGAVGDGVTDDSAAIAACVADCIADNCGLMIPADFNIYLPEYVAISEVRKIKCFGTITAPNGVGFEVDSRDNGVDWYIYKIDGACRMAGMKRGLITLLQATSLELWGDSTVTDRVSIAYNTFVFGDVPTFSIATENNGWVNENIFIGGRFVTFSMSGDYPHNHNQWFNPCLEGATVNIESGWDNQWHSTRCENIVSVTFGVKCVNNYFERGYTSVGTSHFDNAWWHDTSGRNYLYFIGESALTEYKKEYTPTSFNYSGADKLYPSSGKLHNNAYNYNFFATNVIPTDISFNIHIKADAKFLRGYIECYDENGDRITTEPSVSPIRTVGVSWDTTNQRYIVGGTMNWGALNIEVSRYNMVTHEDSGVRYIKAGVIGYGASDFNYFVFSLETWKYNDAIANPFPGERITASTAPANTVVYPEQVLIYNTDATSATLGWWRKSGTWTAIT